jgi:hypothetical protein
MAFCIFFEHLKASEGRALVSHTCNPTYSGGRDQEIRGLKPAQADTW